MTSSPSYPALLAALAPVVRSAAQRAAELRAAGLTKTAKADSSIVTEADTAIEAMLADAIRTIDPATPIVGEEAYAAGTPADTAGAFWLLDPIDGTSAFARGEDDWTVNVGRIEAGRPVLGLVAHAASDMVWAGAEGLGATRNGHPIVPAAWTGRPRILVSHAHLDGHTRAWVGRVAGARVIERGSSIKLCLVADGGADLYVRFGQTREWDTAAGHAVLAAAGGTVLAPGDHRLLYGKPELVNGPFLALGRPEARRLLPPF